MIHLNTYLYSMDFNYVYDYVVQFKKCTCIYMHIRIFMSMMCMYVNVSIKHLVAKPNINIY